MIRLRSLLAIALVTGALAPTSGAAAQAVRLAVKATGPGAVTVTPLGRTGAMGPCNDLGWCSYYYPVGTSVTVSASADSPPATFARWLGDCQQFGARPTCTLNMDAKHAVGARFGPVSLRIAEAIGGGASIDTPGQATCGPGCASFPYGTVVTVTEHEQPDHAFLGWSGWCGNRGSTCSRPLYEPSVTVPRFCQPGPEGCIASQSDPLRGPIRTHFRAVGGKSGRLRVLGTSCNPRRCDTTFNDNTSVVVVAVAARPGFFWSGRCHGSKSSCQFNVGLSPLDGREPVVTAHFP